MTIIKNEFDTVKIEISMNTKYETFCTKVDDGKNKIN
jgi:hypothetical protein